MRAPVHAGGYSFTRRVFGLRRPWNDVLMRLFNISGLSTRSTCRLSARRVAMRANSIGPPRSAAAVISSAAVRMTGVPRSDDGTVLTRCTIASRNDASLTPPGRSMGSGKRLSQDTTQLRNRTGIQVRTGGLVPQSAGESAFRSPRAKRVDRVSQENADAEKDTQCRDYLRHRLAHWPAMPGSAALRNSR
jgi:hypothetical protein